MTIKLRMIISKIDRCLVYCRVTDSPLMQRRKLFMYARTGGKDIRHYSYFDNLPTRDLRFSQASVQFKAHKILEF